MNQLNVIYQCGHKRVVNLDKTFFSEAQLPVGYTPSKRPIVMSPSEKAVSLAYHLDKNPYTIELIRDGKVEIMHTYPQNKPQENAIIRVTNRIKS